MIERRAAKNTMHPTTTRRLSAIALVAAMLALGGCAAAGTTLFGTGVGVAASTGVNYTLNGIAYKTFTAPAADVHAATLATLKRMGMTVKKDNKTTEGHELHAEAIDRDIYIELESVTKTTTRMRINVDKGEIFKDRATATEIIVQASLALDSRLAQTR